MCHCFPTLPLTKPLLCAYQPYRMYARRFIQLSIPLVNGPPVLLGYLDFSIIPCLLLGSPGGGQQYLFICSFKSHGEGCFSLRRRGVFSGSAHWPPPPVVGVISCDGCSRNVGPPLHSCCIKGGGHYVASGP